MKQIFFIEQRADEKQTWQSIFGSETVDNPEKIVEELKDYYKQHPEYGGIPQFQIKKINMY